MRGEGHRSIRTFAWACALVAAVHAIPSSAQTQRSPSDRAVGPPAGSSGVKPDSNSFGGSLGSTAPRTSTRDDRVGSAQGAPPATKCDAIGRLADRNGYVSRDRYMKLMAERFDAADRQRRGAIRVEDARRVAKEVCQGS